MAFLGEQKKLEATSAALELFFPCVNLFRGAQREFFAPAISIVDSLCLLQQYKWNTIKILAIRIKFHDHVILIVSSVAEKIGRFREV